MREAYASCSCALSSIVQPRGICRISVSSPSPLRPASGRAGATTARAKRRALRSAARSAAAMRRMEALLHAGRSSSSFPHFSFLAFAAPRPIRQSRSYHRREQSVAHSGVRHALLPPAVDGSSAPCGAELFLFPAFQSPRLRRSAPHPAEPELPSARAKRRALRCATFRSLTHPRSNENWAVATIRKSLMASSQFFIATALGISEFR
jgi:hypothetical protein